MDASQIKRALIKADQAGDTEAARMLASKLRSMDGINPPKVDPGMRHTGENPAFLPESFAQGIMTPLHGGAQMLEKVLPDSVGKGISKFNNYLVDKGVPLARIPSGGVNQQVADAEKEYQTYRAQKGQSGPDYARTAASIANPFNLAIASKIPAGAGIAKNALYGAGLASLNPVIGKDYKPASIEEYLGTKAKQAAIGGAAGAVVPMIGRAVMPNVPKHISALNKEGVTTTAGQRLGGFPKSVEDKLESYPYIGSMIKGARERTYKEFNRTAINRALTPIGKKLPDNIPEGYKAVTHTKKELGRAYNDVLGKMTGKVDDQFSSEFNQIAEKAKSYLQEPDYNQFKKIILYETSKRVKPDGTISGKSLKEIQEVLRTNASKFGSGDPAKRDIGEAFDSALTSFNKMLARNNPKHAAELQKVNTGWANFKRVQNAAGKQGSESGVFTPAQLDNAVRKLDKSKDNSAYSEGRALMQDLSDNAKQVLPSGSFNSSKTADNMLQSSIMGNLIGGATALPGLLAYPQASSKVVNALLSSRPQIAAPIAQAIKKAQPWLLPPSVAVGQGLLGPTP